MCAQTQTAATTHHAEDTERCCWICLGQDGDLENICNCPQDRVVHRRCLARWQLQSAGRSEEHACRFCSAAYPSWKDSMPLPASLKPATPIVSVHFNGLYYRLKVKPGKEGLANFRKQIQCITGLPELDCMQILFQCRAPETSEEISFRGISSWDAAIHCASIAAAKRQQLAESMAGADGPATSSEAAATLASVPQTQPVLPRTASAAPLAAEQLQLPVRPSPALSLPLDAATALQGIAASLPASPDTAPDQSPNMLRKVQGMLQNLFS